MRLGLVMLAEITGRALSPAVNDPGTAIGIIDNFARLFVEWSGWAPGGSTRPWLGHEPRRC